MPGLQFKIDVELTSDFPVLRHDMVIPDTGALMLIDLTHPFEPAATGILAEGTLLPNIAWEQAADVVGSNKAGVLAEWRTISTPTVARTAKGGLSTSGLYAGARLPLAVVEYIFANPTHALYVSYWGRRHTATPAALTVLKASGGGSGVAYRLKETGSEPIGSRTDQRTGTAVVEGDPVFVNAAYSGHAITGASAYNTRNNYGAEALGTMGDLGAVGRTTYRVYIEDLTASGRTYAEVDAIDYALYTREVLTEGGRYYGDTYP